MWGHCGWQYGVSLRITEVHLCLYGPDQNLRLGYRTQKIKNENDVSHCEWYLQRAQQRLYMPALDNVLHENTGIFFVVIHVWRRIADKLSQGLEREHLLSNISGSLSPCAAFFQYSFHTLAFLFYTQTLPPVLITFLSHLFMSSHNPQLPQSLPLLDVCSLSPYT